MSQRRFDVRLPIDTSRLQFLVVAAAEPLKQGGKLVVDASKTGRTRVVPLLPVVRQELAALQLRKGRPGPGAPIISTAAGEAWRESLFRPFRRHRWSKLAPGMRRTICVTRTSRS
jgi:hypothetical protein